MRQGEQESPDSSSLVGAGKTPGAASDLAAAREKLLARHRRYNQSRKGRRRNQRYEDKNPARKLRWEAGRNALIAQLGKQ